ncbi:hypothetical protein H310_04443 [Aphanomyces invadans]|uniref:Cyclic nucleotide-binding domain-containing protein n=1 Tax=Aphanomyces invadans TaxID=157072 RepID=A0A024UEL2_9STRA|nr:hypothetical protein H310_04443 [Aphanomyces invadans]ETW04063.1 hypothetical protein H310_04443 [Aphanomyces invadans]|eukprot:XP_008867019.1 hypothetical protein H310_04443 [Aphanomyces invadans]
MGLTYGKLSYKEKQDLWGASLLSPLFVEDDLETLSTLSVGRVVVPTFPLINHRCKFALCYEGELTAVIPKIGTVLFKIGPQKQYLGLKRLSTAAGFSFSRVFHKSVIENDNKFVIDTEEMLVSVYASDAKLALASEFLLRFVVNKMNGNEVIIKSFRATSLQVVKRAKVIALERQTTKYDAHSAGVYYLLNNVLNSDSLTLLRSVSFFADLSDEKLVRLADLSTISVLAPDVVIFRENDEEGSEMFIILAGSLEVTVQSKVPGEPPLVLATLQPGSCFGEMALMTRVPRAATVTVVENAMLLSIERKAFLDFLADNKEVKGTMTSLLQDRLMKKALTANIVPFFSAIEYRQIMALSRHFQVEDHFSPGDVIVTPDMYPQQFSIVICGSVEVVDATPDSTMTCSLGPGSHFGAFGSLVPAKTGSPLVQRSVVAKSKCVLFTCAHDAIAEVIETSPIDTAEMFIRWTRDACDVKHVMQHPKAREYLVDFCKSEFSDENVLFLMELQTYMAMATVGQRRSLARHIVDTYIQANAPKQVNIDHHMREGILASMSVIDAGMGEVDEMAVELTMFEPARLEIARLVAKDNFPRFKKAPQFRAMMAAFEPYAHATHISSQDACTQFKENIVLSPRNRNTTELLYKFVKILETVNLHKTRRSSMLRGADSDLAPMLSNKVAIEK